VASLKLFGGLSVETSAGPLTGRAAQRRRLALLALLAASRGLGREKVIACLWPEVDSERGRRLLSDSVYRINKALGGDTIVTAGDELRLDADRLPSDVAAFEAALADGRHREAVGHYGGPFLDGFFLDGAPEFEQWSSRERERLARLQGGALEALAAECEERGDAAGAVTWWYRAAGHDPFSPRVAVRLMEALDRAGERGAALRHARTYADLYRREFEADVDPEVAEFAERLRRAPRAGDVFPAAVRESSVAPPASPTGDDAPDPAAGTAPDTSQQSAPDAAANDTAPSVGRAPTPPTDRAPRGPAATPLIRSALAAVLVLTIVGAAAGWIRHRNGTGPADAGVSAVAVLRFADHSPDGDHEYLAAGMMEEVASALARIDGLRVVAPTAAPVEETDIQRVGRTLGVEAVLQGSVSRWGDSVRINARLMRVADRTFLWTETYTSRMGSIFAIQDSIARAIGATLTERLVRGPHAARAPTTAELEAYNLYLRGRYAWHRRTQESLAAAVSHFEEAVATAPTYARAHAGLADAYAVQGFYDYRPPDDAFPRAESAARRALELDPALAHAHATLAYVSLYYHWNWPEAERAFERAIRLDPGYSTAHQWHANFLTAMGRFGEAETAMRRAMELDPLSLIANGALGWVYYNAGDFARAIEQCNRTLELDPEFKLAWFWSGLAHEALGRHDEAITVLEKALALSPESAITVAALAHAHAMAGQTVRARDLLRGLLAADARYIPSFEVAKVHLALGEEETALEWLETAYEQRSHSMAFLRVDPQLAALQSHPRFRDLLRRVGHPI
jgi:DNA-binding SARP family transcriptional activator/TolB-like protein